MSNEENTTPWWAPFLSIGITLSVAFGLICLFEGGLPNDVRLFLKIPAKYKAGECYASVKKAEEPWEKDEIEGVIKIEQVGNANYVIRYCFNKFRPAHEASFCEDGARAMRMRSVHSLYTEKVACPGDV